MNIFRKNKNGVTSLNKFQQRAVDKQNIELSKNHTRTDVINFLLTKTENKNYLEIGTRNPDDNFNKILANFKKSVDPCFEFDTEEIDFKLTSDDFFYQYTTIEAIKDIKWDVIFIDGLHLAEQVFRDIMNSLDVLANNGFIVLHDCNPPSVYHAREYANDTNTVATGYWNGTVWKAFVKARKQPGLYSACVDTDWGVGILTRSAQNHFKTENEEVICNEFYEFNIFDENRTNTLNLISITKLYEI